MFGTITNTASQQKRHLGRERYTIYLPNCNTRIRDPGAGISGVHLPEERSEPGLKTTEREVGSLSIDHPEAMRVSANPKLWSMTSHTKLLLH